MSDIRIHASQIDFTPKPELGLTGERLQAALEQAAQLGGSGGLQILGESFAPVVAYSLLFVGPGVSLEQGEDNQVIVQISGGEGGGGADVAVEDEGTEIAEAITRLNFVGPGVLAEYIGDGEVRITVNFPAVDVDADQVAVDSTGLSQTIPHVQQWIEHLDGRAMRYSTYTFVPPDTSTTEITVDDPFNAVLWVSVGGVMQPTSAFDVDAGAQTLTFGVPLPSGLPVNFMTVAEDQI